MWRDQYPPMQLNLGFGVGPTPIDYSIGDCACQAGNLCIGDSKGWGICVSTSAPSCAAQTSVCGAGGCINDGAPSYYESPQVPWGMIAVKSCPFLGSCTGTMSAASVTPLPVTGDRTIACRCPTGKYWNGSACIAIPACNQNTVSTATMVVSCKTACYVLSGSSSSGCWNDGPIPVGSSCASIGKWDPAQGCVITPVRPSSATEPLCSSYVTYGTSFFTGGTGQITGDTTGSYCPAGSSCIPGMFGGTIPGTGGQKEKCMCADPTATWNGTACVGIQTGCCATGPGTPRCTGILFAPGINEVADPSKCTSGLTGCCSIGPGNPTCTGVGGLPTATEFADLTKCNGSTTPTPTPVTTTPTPTITPIPTATPTPTPTPTSAPNPTSSPTINITTDTYTDGTNGKVCGTKRISVNANNTVLDITTSGAPNTTASYTYPTTNRCVCSYKDYPKPAQATYTTTGAVIPQTLPPDTFQKISSQNNSGTLIDYSPVAIARDSKEGTRDGRVGSLFSTGASQCGCPNLNEVYAPLIPGDPNKPQGAYCRSALTGDHQVLMTFNPDVHDATPATTQVIDRANAITDTINDEVVTKIALPVSTGSAKTQAYTRRIWACSTGFVVDVNAKKCVFKPLEHQCSVSSANGALASAASNGVSGNSLDEKFTHTINKKLSCCLNAYTKGFSNLKFDCIDNSSTADTSFDALWASSDLAADGGQLNAVVLSDSKGKPVSGFYTLDGARCSGYSEFGGVLQPRTVNPVRAVTGQIEKVVSTNSGDGIQNTGSALPLPSGSSYNYISSKTGFNQVPTTQAELARCPILVRAAMKAECGANEAIPAVQTTIDENSALGLPGSKKRCTNASKISIHVQVMQLTKIAGMAPMKTFDTVADPKSAARIDIGKIVGSKNSGECADGAKRVGSQCVYQ